ncbi:MAG: hypothetical protein KAU62_16930 [Candidatus Heimdallarchaeota archaeon]|nr:hypothetical protein [Candidatus Heimdallarchaeota archaeon]MCK4612843.1 hypothetical protein [Candidatus Heimdallarchaeota archaeon]
MKKKNEKKIIGYFKLKKNIWERENYEEEELFDRIYGHQFVKQMKNLSNFTLKSILGNSAFKLVEFLPDFIKHILSDKFEMEIVKKKYLEEEDYKKYKSFKDLFKKEILQEEDFTYDLPFLLEEEEQIVFVAYLVIASCTYFEVFVENLMDKIIDLLILNSSFYSQNDLNAKNIIYEINRNSHLNGFDQIRHLLKILNVKNEFERLTKMVDLGKISKIVYEIKELRNQLAHEEPFPDFSFFSKEEFRNLNEYIENLQLDIDAIIEDEIKKEKIPKDLMKLIDPIVQFVKKQLPVIQMIQSIPDIIIKFASLIDGYLFGYFSP